MKGFFKKFGAVLCAQLMLINSALCLSFAAEPDYSEYYALMLKRWEDTLTGGDGYDRTDTVIAKKIAELSASARTYLETMTAADAWDTNGDSCKSDTKVKGYIWADLDPCTLSEFEQYSYVNNTYNRVKELALAYRIGEDDLRGKEELKNKILSAMDWLNKNWFNDTTTQYGNWFYWQIGVPLSINDILVLMYGDLSSYGDGTLLERYMAAIDHFPPQQGHVLVGANQIWYDTVLAIRGALGGNYEKIEKAQKGIVSVLPYVTSGDGFYEDGSFVQHGMYAYTGGYGSSLMKNLTPVLQTLAGTPWEITDSNINNVYRWIYDSFEPLFYKGAFMDMVRGREISRYLNTSYDTGRYILESIIRIAQFAPEEDAAYFKSLVKYMIDASNEVYDFYGKTSIQLYLSAKEIADDDTVPLRGEYELYKMYSSMDRAVQHRADYSVGISMHSSRIAAFEKINGENIKGWYTGSGMLYLYNNDLTQFSDNFWCTVDSRRLPGTTVLRGVTDLPAESGSINARGRNSWTGGTGILGLYGTAGMQLEPTGQTLSAKKSYFMFDNEIVCLGSDISANDGTTVETTVENRMLNSTGDNVLTVNGSEMNFPLTAMDSSDANVNKLTNVRWAHLEGNTDGSDIGYYFPNGTDLNVKREARSGKWSDLNKLATQTDSTEYTRNYLTMYLDHGASPSDGTYSYVLLPGASSGGVSEYAENPEIEVLANSGEVQSVIDNSLGVTGANFWSDKETTVFKDGEEWITCNSKASVMVAQQNGEISISVSDPTQENNGLIGVEINASAVSVISKDESITVLQTSPSVMLLVDVSGAAGKSFEITLEAGTVSDGTQTAPQITADGEIIARGGASTVISVDTVGARPMSFNLSEDAPDGVTLDRFGLLKISESISLGNHSFSITVTNAYGSDTKTFTIKKRNSTVTAEWNFDEGTGSTFSDSTGVSRSTELVNGALWSADGYSGPCLEFPKVYSGSIPVAVVKTTSDLNFKDGIEIDFRVSFAESPTAENGRTQLLLEKRAATGTSYIAYAVRVSNEGKIGLCWDNVWYESEPMQWETDTWYNLFILHDGYKITFERNGEAIGLIPNTEKASAVNSYFAIGAGKTQSNCFAGKIDELTLSAPNEKGGLMITSSDSLAFVPNSVTDTVFQVTVNDSENQVYYGLYGAPDGVTIDNNGLITVASNSLSEGTYKFYVTASYTDKADATQAFTITSESIPEANPSGSVIYWNFNEGSGTIANTKSNLSTVHASVDYSGVLGGNTQWVEGFVGTGLRFSDKSDTLTVSNTMNWSAPTAIGMDPKSSGNKFGGGVEYDFWVNFDVSPLEHEQYIISRRNEGGKIPYAVKVTTEGKISYCWSSSWVESEALTDWNTGEWYHINIVRMKDGTVTIKRDGITVGSGSNTLAVTSSGAGVVVNYTGQVSESNCFKGILDEFYMGALGGGAEIVLRSKVSFNTRGGSEVSPQYAFTDETAALPETPEKTGYTFCGWYTDAECTNAYDFDTLVTNDITLYAKWGNNDPVTDISDIGTMYIAERDYNLSGSVLAENGTNYTVEWSVKDSGSAQTEIIGNKLKALSTGQSVITATVIGGTADGEDYTKDFTVYAYQKGDVNGDNEIDIRDLVHVKKHSDSLSDDTLHAPLADIDGDGEINSSDVAELRRILLNQ